MHAIASLLNRYQAILIMLVSLLMAVVFGLIATTANVIAVSLVMALFVGAFLLTRTAWIIWLVLFLGLLIVGPVPLYNSSLDPKAGWPVQILCFFLMFVALFKVVTNAETPKNTPAYIWLMLGFFIFAVLNSMINWHSPVEFFGGIKRYFQMWGLLFALCWLDFDGRYINRWRVFFIIVALVQLPFCLYELIVWVPIRDAVRGYIPGLVPVDIIGGTFGSVPYGGGASGEMATFLVIVMAFLLSRKMQKVLSVRWLILLMPGVLAPLFVGETKAVIVMFPLMFLVLYRRDLLAKPHYAVVALIVGTLLTLGMGYAYLLVTEMTFDKLFADTVSYNLEEKGYGNNFLNRTTALTFWASHQGWHDPISLVFGNGLGSAHEKTGGHIDIHYPRYGIGLTAASTLLWDTGVFGCGLVVTIFSLAWHTAGRLYQESIEPTVRADAAAIQAALALFVFHIFYRLDLLETVSYQIVFTSVMGYLAWLYRRHTALTARSVA
ncbi:MAG: hypothetical protein PHR16_15490 [Methylovulum sp.]|nr:hypothetical protein [Methylovulum sp.]